MFQTINLQTTNLRTQERLLHVFFLLEPNKKFSKITTIMEKNITINFESLNISSNGSQSISTDKKESKSDWEQGRI